MAGKARRVAIGVDDSEYAEQAFNFYIDNCGHPDDYIVLIHAPEMFNFVDASPGAIQEMLEEINRRVKRLEEKYTALMAAKGMKHGKFCTLEGKPGEQVVKKAHDEKCDVIVVGCRGQGKFKRALFGSTSSFCVHNADIPVLVCRR